MTPYRENSIFWVEVDKIKPNPYQPRHEFDEDKLKDLAESIRQYGVLQPLVVTRTEVHTDDGGLRAVYELIAGERRLRAAKIAGVGQVPVIIRSGEESNRMKLELAIIENLQREDLNPVDRAQAFQRLVSEFKFKHGQVAKQIGKSREYVSNSIRLLALPEEIQQALADGRLSEGHARPMMMLNDRPDEQNTLFREILYKKITVREAERVARKIAYDKTRKREETYSPQVADLEGQLTESLGTRVHIEQKEVGGKVVIDYFSDEDLYTLLDLFKKAKNPTKMLERYIQTQEANSAETGEATASTSESPAESTPSEPAVTVPENENISPEPSHEAVSETSQTPESETAESKETTVPVPEDDTEKSEEQEEAPESKEKEKAADDDLYSVRNFSI